MNIATKPRVGAAQQTRTAFNDPGDHDHEPEEATKKRDFERVHRLRRDADQDIHHDRADSVEQNP